MVRGMQPSVRFYNQQLEKEKRLTKVFHMQPMCQHRLISLRLNIIHNVLFKGCLNHSVEASPSLNGQINWPR